jgi:hypothetical protein
MHQVLANVNQLLEYAIQLLVMFVQPVLNHVEHLPNMLVIILVLVQNLQLDLMIVFQPVNLLAQYQNMLVMMDYVQNLHQDMIHFQLVRLLAQQLQNMHVIQENVQHLHLDLMIHFQIVKLLVP